jgi:hypothetical protein
MNENTGARSERRLHTRIAPKGAVLLHALGQTTRGRVANISEGGMFVVTRVKTPDRLLARVVDVELRLDGARAEWLSTSARIVRVQATGVAMAFAGPPPAMLVRMLDELTTASHANARVITVVLIDAATQRRTAMAAGFRATGCIVIEAATPLDAIVRLGESTFEPDVIAVADTATSTDAEEMRAFIERDHPNAKLITIGDEIFQPDGFANWLSSSNPDADLPRRVREALVAPRGPKRP